MELALENPLNRELKPDCGKCFGLCCAALFFSASEGFPEDKKAGKPCVYLQRDFTCSIHRKLREKEMKGCIAYECFGAGQKAAQVTFGGRDWQQFPESAEQMFSAFLHIKQLHEMLWYLAQAYDLNEDPEVRQEIKSLLKETECHTLLEVRALLELDIEGHRGRVNRLLRDTSERVRAKFCSRRKASAGEGASPGKSTSPWKRKNFLNQRDYFGTDIRKKDLRGADFRGACLVAANLEGADLTGADLLAADLRDANIGGADLSHSIFLTQVQVNSAKGNGSTRLPEFLVQPDTWKAGF